MNFSLHSILISNNQQLLFAIKITVMCMYLLLFFYSILTLKINKMKTKYEISWMLLQLVIQHIYTHIHIHITHTHIYMHAHIQIVSSDSEAPWPQDNLLVKMIVKATFLQFFVHDALDMQPVKRSHSEAYTSYSTL